MSNARGASNIAERLLDTLQQEGNVLTNLTEEFTLQLEAVREQQLQQLETSTDDANEFTSKLHNVQQSRKRQMRLLSRVLDLQEDASLTELATALRPHDAALSERLERRHETLRDEAESAQQQCEELEFTLRYAVGLGREVLEILHGTEDEAETAGAYTANGASSPFSSSSFVNELG